MIIFQHRMSAEPCRRCLLYHESPRISWTVGTGQLSGGYWCPAYGHGTPTYITLPYFGWYTCRYKRWGFLLVLNLKFWILLIFNAALACLVQRSCLYKPWAVKILRLINFYANFSNFCKLIWKFQVQENNLVHLFEDMTNASVLSEIKVTFG